MLKQRIGADGRGLRPGIKLRQTDQDRNEHHRRDHDHLCTDFKRATQRSPPMAASDVVDHQHEQTADAQAGDKGEADQIGAEKGGAVGDQPDDGRDCTQCARPPALPATRGLRICFG